MLPLILGALADMDLKGRMMSIPIAVQMVGLGLGPIVSAQLIDDGNFGRAAWLCIGGFLASLLLIAPSLRAQGYAARNDPD